MDTRLQIVQRLYSEGEENHVPHPAGSDRGDDLDREFQAMSQAKFWMDHRRRQRPDAATVDRVVEAAASAAQGGVPGVMRPDRSPLRLITSPRFRMAVAATLVAVVAGVGVWRSTLRPESAADVMMKEESELQLGEERMSQPQPQAPAMADADDASEGVTRPGAALYDSAMLASRRDAAEAARVTAAAATEWDEKEEVVRLHQRIEMLRSRQSDEGWDRPVVPLEMMPAGGRDAGIHQAGSNRD